MPLILPSNSISAGGYEVDNSLRFDDGSSDYLSQTFSGSGNQKTFTISFWFKRSNLVNGNVYTYQGEGNEIRSEFIFFNDYLKIVFNPTGSSWSSDMKIQNNGTDILFRDVSAWYHVVLAIDTTQSTEANRIKPYVNGVLQSMSAYPTLNYDTGYNTAIEHGIGTYIHATNTFFDGYFAEFCVIDGQQLDATSFGEFDEDTGIWKPISVSGLTFGTNGFYLDFENSGSLGADVSGNGNNFTVNNLTSIDQTTDTPTNNFATLMIIPRTDASTTNPQLSDGNTTVNFVDNTYFTTVVGSIACKGKYYWEVKITSFTTGSNTGKIGITDLSQYPNGNPNNYYVGYTGDGTKINYGTGGSYGNTWTTGDIIGVAFDSGTGTIWFSVNGVWQNSATISEIENGTTTNSAYTGLSTSIDWQPIVISFQNRSASINFGNPPFTISSGNSDGNGMGNFEYSVPSGYYSLNTKNLAQYG